MSLLNHPLNGIRQPPECSTAQSVGKGQHQLLPLSLKEKERKKRCTPDHFPC